MKKIVRNKILNNLYLIKSIGYKYISPIDFNKYSSKIELPNDINKLKDIVDNCNLCTLSNSCKEKIFSFGNINSKVMFISTLPFNNNASVNNLFNTMVENVLNVNKDSISLISIVKCSGDLKLDSISTEIDICKEYLIKQVGILRPKLIVTLGDSYNYLVNSNQDIANVRGMFLKYNNITLLPMYHPSLLLRNPSLKKDAMIDLKKIKYLMESF